jgi:hypothetical protein
MRVRRSLLRGNRLSLSDAGAAAKLRFFTGKSTARPTSPAGGDGGLMSTYENDTGAFSPGPQTNTMSWAGVERS